MSTSTSCKRTQPHVECGARTRLSVPRSCACCRYGTKGQQCVTGSFSPNFLAARPNTTLWQGAWARLLVELKGKCIQKKPSRRQVACCYTRSGAPMTCLTPWGFTDRIARPVAEELAANLTFSVYCLEGQASLAPFAGFRPGHLTPMEEACVVCSAGPRRLLPHPRHASLKE